MRYFIHLAYKGTPFQGWQIQPSGITVQGVLNNVLSILLKQKINLTGCGRTDSGVHACNFYAHFDYILSNTIEDKLCYKLNAILPSEIAVFSILPVKEDANARFDTISRTYKYYISKNKDPFYGNYQYRVFENLDIDKMNKAASILVKNTNFECFSKTNTQVNNYLCTITEAKWTAEGELLVFTITANRFLRNMVRAIVGTLLDIGKGKVEIKKLQQIIDSKDRSYAGMSVPANALFLYDVRYPADIFINQFKR